MGLEVETATEFPHKLQREGERKKKIQKKSAFLQPAPLADDKNLDTSRPYNLYPLHVDPRLVYYVYVLQK